MTALLEVLLWALALPPLAWTGYLFALTLLSGRKAAKTLPAQALGVTFDLVVPAHNEEAGIAQTVQSLLDVEWPAAQRRVVVVADNCSDGTAEKAREAGATVLVRNDSERRGKGYALDHAFRWSAQDGFARAVVVVDADSVVSKNVLSAFAARLASGEGAAQAEYGVRNPSASWRTRLVTLAFTLFHEVRSLGRERLGLSCGLRGNGMCFAHEVLAKVPHDAFSVVEDVEYGLRLGRAGVRVAYAHEAQVLGEMVAHERASRSQRERWEGGRLSLMRTHGLPMLRDALQQKSALLFDLAMDLLVPPLSWVALWSVAGAALTVLVGVALGTAFSASFAFALALAFLTLYVARGLWLSPLGWRGVVDLLCVPLYVGWKLALLVTGRKRRSTEWIRTAREGEAP